MKSPIFKLVVNVPVTNLDLAAFKRFQWTPQLIDHISSAAAERGAGSRIEDSFVAATLDVAFELGLSRKDAWDISRCPTELRNGMNAAAHLFKRGVPVTVGESVVESSFPLFKERESSYEVGFFRDIFDLTSCLGETDFVIVDETVYGHWWPHLPDSVCSYPFSEQQKFMTSANDIAKLISARVSQSITRVVVIGGGVAGDIVGLASGLSRIPCHFVPTTLLAMVDSSLGGKVGVNHEKFGKNQLGLFINPDGVSISTHWLSSLDQDEISSGMMEALKHAAIAGDSQLWTTLVTLHGSQNLSLLQLRQILEIKKNIIELDPYERGPRVFLNFGHTLAHALESIALKRQSTLRHGIAVGLGMVYALRLSKIIFGFNTDKYVRDLLESKLLPDRCSLSAIFGEDVDSPALGAEIIGLMKQDKKANSDGLIQFVLLKEFGSPIVVPVDPELAQIPFLSDA